MKLSRAAKLCCETVAAGLAVVCGAGLIIWLGIFVTSALVSYARVKGLIN